MYIGKTLFAQIMDFIPWTSFGRIVARYHGNARVRTLPCTEQFRVMAFAQITWRESLRDIEACLSVQLAKSTIWDCEKQWRVPRWLMPMNRETGVSGLISRRS